MDWLIRQLFGTHAMSSLLDKIRAEVGLFLAAHPEASEAVVTDWVVSQADRLVAKVLIHFPGWASAILLAYLNHQVGSLIAAAYKEFGSTSAKAISAGGQMAA